MSKIICKICGENGKIQINKNDFFFKNRLIRQKIDTI